MKPATGNLVKALTAALVLVVVIGFFATVFLIITGATLAIILIAIISAMGVFALLKSVRDRQIA